MFRADSGGLGAGHYILIRFTGFVLSQEKQEKSGISEIVRKLRKKGVFFLKCQEKVDENKFALLKKLAISQGNFQKICTFGA